MDQLGLRGFSQKFDMFYMVTGMRLGIFSGKYGFVSNILFFAMVGAVIWSIMGYCLDQYFAKKKIAKLLKEKGDSKKDKG